MSLLSNRLDGEKDLDDFSLDFNQAFPGKFQAPGRPVSDQPKVDSGPLWVPGKKRSGAGKFLPVIPNQSEGPLSAAEKAAEELNDFYATLPETSYDLTFQHLVEQNDTPQSGLQREAKANTGDATEKRWVEKDLAKDDRKVKGASRERGVVKSASKQYGVSTDNSKALGTSIENRSTKGASKENRAYHENPNSPSIFQSKRSKVPFSKSPLSTPEHPINERAEELLAKRAKKSPKREPMFSPTASFRRVSPDSPTLSGKSSARTSFTDYMTPTERNALDKELSKQFGFVVEDNSAAEPVESRALQRRLSDSRSRNARKQQEMSECSRCSLRNLGKETHCLRCGKIYCNRCMAFATRVTREGRICMSNCKPVPDDYSKLRKPRTEPGGCLPFLFCFRQKHRAHYYEDH